MSNVTRYGYGKSNDGTTRTARSYAATNARIERGAGSAKRRRITGSDGGRRGTGNSLHERHSQRIVRPRATDFRAHRARIHVDRNLREMRDRSLDRLDLSEPSLSQTRPTFGR